MPNITAAAAAALPIHPAANLMPPMSAAELDALTLDIQANGQRIPVALFNGQVLDGRHRVQAIGRLGTDVRVAELPAGTDPFAYVFSTNGNRRSLSTSQRAMVAVKLMEQMNISAGTAANRVGVSTAYISMARNVMANLPEEASRVWSGEVSLGVVHRRLRRAQRPDLNHAAGRARRAAALAPVAAPAPTAPVSGNPMLDALRWIQSSGIEPAAWIASLPAADRAALVVAGDEFFRLAYDTVSEAGLLQA